MKTTCEPAFLGCEGLWTEKWDPCVCSCACPCRTSLMIGLRACANVPGVLFLTDAPSMAYPLEFACRVQHARTAG